MLGNRRESATERALRSALHARGRRFRKDYAPIAGLRCRVDVAFTRDRLAIFVDGCFWHRCPQHASDPKANGAWWQAKLDGNVARDRRNDKALRDAGWTVLRLWAHEPTHVMADRVLEVLAELQAMRPERTGGVAQPPDAG
jgi:DNA mismatch endonuclease (patch repair protein)